MKYDSPTTTELLAEIDRLQGIQKRNSPKSEAWQSASALLQPLFAEMSRRRPLRPGTRVYHGSREASVLAVDADPEAHAWVVYCDNPDEDAMVHRSDLATPCSVCEKVPGTIDALDCDVPALVCAGCFEYYNGTGE